MTTVSKVVEVTTICSGCWSTTGSSEAQVMIQLRAARARADNDTFIFDAPTGTSTDSVVDFGVGTDHLAVHGADYGLLTGTLDPDCFETGATPTKGHAEFFYDATAQTLYWDADGSAEGSVAIATFETAVTLNSTDFQIL
jgi:hypothetical protein